MLKIIYKRLNIGDLSPKERRKAEHEGAIALLKDGLASLGILSPCIRVADGGKPYLAGASLHFNLSHSEGFCACAISDVPVGIDVEAIRPKEPDFMKRMAERMFTDEEARELAASGFSAEVFFEIWVKKEALVKRSGVGITGMRAVDSSTERVFYQRIGDFALAVCADGDEVFLPTEASDTDPHKKSG
ncbi:MAG: 4'-phosphopantetheinyl transferase superfamily protein [Clostridia bacterium]|nr:4'-phosphopantetheinyl transferase superfamily protein [Clostridia bacterium]